MASNGWGKASYNTGESGDTPIVVRESTRESGAPQIEHWAARGALNAKPWSGDSALPKFEACSVRIGGPLTQLTFVRDDPTVRD